MNVHTYISVIKNSSVEIAQAVEYMERVKTDQAENLYKLSVYLHKLSYQLNQNYRSALRYLQPAEQVDLLSLYHKEVVSCLTALSLPVSNELIFAHQNLVASHQAFKQNLLAGKVNLLELNLIEDVAEYYAMLAKTIGNYYSHYDTGKMTNCNTTFK